MEKETSLPSLTDRVAAYWESCLEVNSSWRQFTNEFGVMNTLFGVCELDVHTVGFVASYLTGYEEFEGETFEDLAKACLDFASTRFVEPEYIDSGDLANLYDSGYDQETIIESAESAGVSPLALAEFAEYVEEEEGEEDEG